MAASEHTTSRRAILGALAIVPAIAAVAFPAIAAPAAHDDLTVWKMELAKFRRIEAAHDAYDRDFWMPAYEADPTRGQRIPASIDEEMERHQEAWLTAMDRLIERVPAPNAGAVLLKLEMALERSECFEGLFPDHQKAILADLGRLAEREA